MARIEKTVFLSYRRTDQTLATLIFKDLTHHGYDVFIDFDGIAAGDFERVILENIASRAHFLVLLTEHALDKCDDPSDWMRREVEAAIDARRNVVSLLDPKFDFGSPITKSRLTGKLAALARYNGLPLPIPYFDTAMERLRTKYLSIPLDAVLHPPSKHSAQVARELQRAATVARTELPQVVALPPDHVAVVLLAHHPIASALAAAAAKVFPQASEAVVAVDVGDDESPSELEHRTLAAVGPLRATSHLVLTDVFGATPCNVAMHLGEVLPNCKVVAGVNLPMLWRTLNYITLPLDDVVSRAMAGGVQGIMPVASRKGAR